MMFSLPLIFAAGLLSFASPCVLPMMPVYLATLAGGAITPGAGSRRVFGMAAAFASGLSLVFVALGALAATLGDVLLSLRPWLIGASIVMMLLFGLRGLGLVRLPMADADARPLLTRVRTSGGFVAAFFFGAAFALGWSPCIGPLLASLLTYAATHADSPWQSAGYLGVYAAGFSTPLLVLAALSAHVMGTVRKLNRFLPTFERVTGAAMIALAGVLAYTELAPLRGSSEPPLADAAAITPPSASAAACEQSAGEGTTCALSLEPAVAMEAPPSQEGLHVLQFTSGSCPACERMRPVLEKVREACGEHAVPLISVDVASERGRSLATHHAVRGTPTFVFMGTDGKETSRLIGEADVHKFVDVLRSTLKVDCSQGLARRRRRAAARRPRRQEPLVQRMGISNENRHDSSPPDRSPARQRLRHTTQRSNPARYCTRGARADTSDGGSHPGPHPKASERGD